MEEKKKERRGSVPHLITMLKGGEGVGLVVALQKSNSHYYKYCCFSLI